MHGCEIQVQKYPRHSEMCRQNMKWDLKAVRGGNGENLILHLFMAVPASWVVLLPERIWCHFCRVLWEVHAHDSASTKFALFLHFLPRRMASLTGNESEACRRGHHLAIVLVFVHVAHPSQDSSWALSRQKNYSILEEKEVAEYLSPTKSNGKAVEKPSKHNGSFCPFFLKKARVILIL